MTQTLELTGELDPRDGWKAERCSIGKALDVVSTRSAFLLLREAFYGTQKFDDFVGRTDLSEPAAARRLRELVDEGLLAREDYREPGQRTRQRYLLTEKGDDLFPVLAALMQWGDRWCNGGAGPIELRHRDCGAPVDVELRCAAGHRVSAGDLQAGRRPRMAAG